MHSSLLSRWQGCTIWPERCYHDLSYCLRSTKCIYSWNWSFFSVISVPWTKKVSTWPMVQVMDRNAALQVNHVKWNKPSIYWSLLFCLNMVLSVRSRLSSTAFVAAIIVSVRVFPLANSRDATSSRRKFQRDQIAFPVLVQGRLPWRRIQAPRVVIRTIIYNFDARKHRRLLPDIVQVPWYSQLSTTCW